MKIATVRPSSGATALARALHAKRLLRDGRILRNQTVINWGCGPKAFSDYARRLQDSRVINNPLDVADACNKLTAFRVLEEAGVHTVPFTDDSDVARGWLRDGASVVCRHTLYGHSGEGIVIEDNYTEFINRPRRPPLYTKYVKKAGEYRVHVVGDATNIQQKKKRQEVPREKVNFQVRNHQNGWVYCRDDLEIPNGINDLAVSAVQALNLDFGAVDIIWNRHADTCYVLEVNTAPGLEGETINFYSTNLRGY